MRVSRPFPVLLALSLPLAACSGGEDPCAIATGGVSITAQPASQVNADDVSMSCADTRGVVRCSGAVELTPATCTDGFAYTLESGNAKVLLRFQGGDRWTAGARLAGGEELSGSITYAGLGADPIPPAGSRHEGEFFLKGTTTNFDGTLVADW